MRCPACGVKLAHDAIYCQQCGSRVSWEATAEEHLATRNLVSADEPETKLWQGTYSWKGMAGTFLLAIGITVVLPIGLLIADLPPEGLGLGIASLAIGWLLIAGLLVLRKLNVHYELTNQRFIHRRGILFRTTDRVETIDLDDVSCEQGIIERILGSGTIVVRSSDRSHPTLRMRGVNRVHEVAHQMDEARRRERLRRGLYVEAI
ncbi:MAG: PH domain-containing protein [Pirellulaceae bacterium]